MQEEIFEKYPIPKAYFKLALPVVFSMVISLVYNMVDTYFIAGTGNTDLVAGVALGSPIFTLMIALGDIFGLGGSSFISRLFGEKRYEDAKRISVFSFYGAIVSGVAVAAVLMIFRSLVLGLLGASEATWEYASQYYTCIALGAPFIIVALTPSNQLRTEGFATASMVGFAFGGQPLTGYNYGARNRTRLKATLKFAYLLEGGMALVLMAVLGFFAPQMVKIFMSDPSVVENGALMLRLQLAGMLCMGIVLISTCTFQSAGQAMGAFLLSVSRQGVVFAVVLMIALKVAGYYGVLASQAISDFLTAVLAVVLVWRWWKKVDF